MAHSIWLFFVKHFTSHQPAIITYEYESTDDFLFELPNKDTLRIHPGQWKLSVGQHVLLETFSGCHYFMYKPITKSDYEYLTR